jgi:uncharacterized protein YuzE
MNKQSIFYAEYNAESDILLIHSKKGKSKESIELSEDIIIDIDKNNELVGLEFLYASEFFKALNKDISKEILQNLDKIKIILNNYRNYLWISLEFNINEEVVKEKLPAFSLAEYESPLLSIAE